MEKVRNSLIYALKPFRHFLKKPRIEARERTKLCYLLFNKWCSEICGIDCWADCAVGEFEQTKEKYRAKYQEILDLVQCGSETNFLEIGPGTGELLKMATARAKSAVGLEICPENVASCRARGLEIVEGDATISLLDFPENHFDAIVANSSMEHAVTEEDAFEGQGDEIYQRFFQNIARILKPGGKFYLSLIHFRNPEVAADALKDPFHFPVLSKKFHLALLAQTFAGWYPYAGQLDPIAQKSGLKKVAELDKTEDYLASCANWGVLQFLLKPRCLYRLLKDKDLRKLIFRYPYYIYLHLVKLLAYSWDWQFLPSKEEAGSTPTVYLCNIYEKPSRER